MATRRKSGHAKLPTHAEAPSAAAAEPPPAPRLRWEATTVCPGAVMSQSYELLASLHAASPEPPTDELLTATRFIPTALLQRLAAQRDAPPEPAVEETRGAVLFCDMSGFSKLGERLNKGQLLFKPGRASAAGDTRRVARLFRGQTYGERAGSGADQLRSVLDVFFGSIIRAISAAGGDVVRVAGDALISVFADDAADERVEVLRGCICALDCVERMRDVHFRGLPLQLHAALGAGALRTFYVGGHSQRWQYVLCGAPLAQIEAALDSAGASEVLLSPEAWAHVADLGAETIRIAEHGGDAAGLGLGRLEFVDPAAAELHAADERRRLAEAVVGDAACHEALCRFLPLPVFFSLFDADLEWTHGTRRFVTVLFVSIEGLVHMADAPEAALAALQEVTVVMQAALDDHCGVLKELSVDDKGMVLVAGFGVPPLVRGEPPSSAVLAGERIMRELRARGIGACVGVATGLVFCGSLGSPERGEFAMVSATVNLAARLMAAVKKDGSGRFRHADVGVSGLLVEQSTWEQCNDARLAFERLEPIMVKGRAEPVSVFVPTVGEPRAAAAVPMVRFQPDTPPLSQQETAELVCATVGSDDVAQSLLDAVHIRARGLRPFVLALARGLVLKAERRGFDLARPSLDDVINFASWVPADARAYLDATLTELRAGPRVFAKAAVMLGVPTHAADLVRLVQRFRAKRGRAPAAAGGARAALESLERHGLLLRAREDSTAGQMAHPNVLRHTESIAESGPPDAFFEPCMPLLGDAVGQTLSHTDRRDLHQLCLTLYDRTELVRYIWTVQHCTAAHEEDKARTALDLLESLGPGFVAHWVDAVVSHYLDLGVGARPAVSREQRAKLALLSLPWLRGIWRAMRLRATGNAILKAAARLRAPLVARRERSATLARAASTAAAPPGPVQRRASDPFRPANASPADHGRVIRVSTFGGGETATGKLMAAALSGAQPGGAADASADETRRAQELAREIATELAAAPEISIPDDIADDDADAVEVDCSGDFDDMLSPGLSSASSSSSSSAAEDVIEGMGVSSRNLLEELEGAQDELVEDVAVGDVALGAGEVASGDVASGAGDDDQGWDTDEDLRVISQDPGKTACGCGCVVQ